RVCKHTSTQSFYQSSIIRRICPHLRRWSEQRCITTRQRMVFCYVVTGSTPGDRRWLKRSGTLKFSSFYLKPRVERLGGRTDGCCYDLQREQDAHQHRRDHQHTRCLRDRLRTM